MIKKWFRKIYLHKWVYFTFSPFAICWGILISSFLLMARTEEGTYITFREWIALSIVMFILFAMPVNALLWIVGRKKKYKEFLAKEPLEQKELTQSSNTRTAGFIAEYLLIPITPIIQKLFEFLKIEKSEQNIEEQENDTEKYLTPMDMDDFILRIEELHCSEEEEAESHTHDTDFYDTQKSRNIGKEKYFDLHAFMKACNYKMDHEDEMSQYNAEYMDEGDLSQEAPEQSE